MKVLIIGGGGREHALAWKVAQSPRVKSIQVSPGNGGTEETGRITNVPVVISPSFVELIEHCTAERVDLVIVGPEAPLVAGVADALDAAKIPCFGASKAAARLEGSKTFTRTLTRAAGIPSHAFESFSDATRAKDFYRAQSEPWWIKADGLAAGKGAVLPASADAGCALLGEWLNDGAMGEAGRNVVVEEPLTGTETSIIAIADGETVRCFAPSQDHKRLLDGDAGPNTGGMGAFAPTPHVSPSLLAEIERDFLVPTLRQLAKTGVHFRGFLYAGIMLTPAGPRLLEYNVRLGDPEAQVILPLLKDDLIDVIEATLAGNLASVSMAQRTEPDWQAAVTVVAAAEGYPASLRRGDTIDGLAEAEHAAGDQALIFHAGTKRAGTRVVTAGGRVLAVTGHGADLATARGRAHAVLGNIHWAGMQFRRDIAHLAAV